MFQQRFINISFIQRGCLGCLHLQFQLQQNQAFLFFVCLLVGWALTKNALRSNQQLYLQHGEIHIHTLIYLYIFNLSLKLTFLPLTPQGGTPSALSSESTKCKKQNIIALPRSERVPLHWHWEFQRNIRSEYSHERMQSTHGENVKKKMAVGMSAASMKPSRKTGESYGNQKTRSEVIPVHERNTSVTSQGEKGPKWRPQSGPPNNQAKAIGHQVSPLTEPVTSAEDVSPTLV